MSTAPCRHLAAAEGCYSVVEWLLTEGKCVPNPIDRFKRTPLEVHHLPVHLQNPLCGHVAGDMLWHRLSMSQNVCCLHALCRCLVAAQPCGPQCGQCHAAISTRPCRLQGYACTEVMTRRGW